MDLIFRCPLLFGHEKIYCIAVSWYRTSWNRWSQLRTICRWFVSECRIVKYAAVMFSYAWKHCVVNNRCHVNSYFTSTLRVINCIVTSIVFVTLPRARYFAHSNHVPSISGHPHRPGGVRHRVIQDRPLWGDVRLDHHLLQLPLHAEMGELAFETKLNKKHDIHKHNTLWCGAPTQSQCFVMFSFRSSSYQSGCTVAALSAQRPVEHYLQNITT